MKILSKGEELFTLGLSEPDPQNTTENEDPLLDQAKALAAQEGITLRNVVEEGLRAVLRKRARRKSPAFKLKDKRFRGGRGLQPRIEWRDLPSLAYSQASWEPNG